MVEAERIALLENEIGNIYGDLRVTGYRHEKGKVDFLQCECEKCGRTRSIRFSQIRSSECKHGIKTVYDESFAGRKKNNLTVVEVRDGRFICQCDCGNTVITTPSEWNSGLVRSCGCLSRNARVEHTPELDRLRRIRNGMISRCENPNNTSYEYYGGRGVSVCQEWRDSFDEFAEWALSHGYGEDLSIDRIDNDGNYEPSNCRWASDKQQICNQRLKRGGYLYRGKHRSQTEIAKMLKIPPTTLNYKMKQGMNMEKIVRDVERMKAKGRYGKDD